MMEHSDILLVALAFLLFGLVSRRLDRSPVTAPMIFAGLGLLAAPQFFAILHFEIAHEILYGIAELTLMLILFSDAAKIELTGLRKFYALPLRLLLIGLPLVILFGTLAAAALYPAISIFTALLIAAILAPTDAALGLAVVEDRRLPQRIRETLSVESGLNDGLALPAVLILVSLAGAMGGMDAMAGTPATWIAFAAAQIVLGPLAGIAAGWLGGLLIRRATQRRWMHPHFVQISILILAPAAYALASLIGGNGFLAAFCAGLAFGHAARGMRGHVYEFAELEGRFLLLLTFLFFGAALAPEALLNATPRDLLYALLSLTVIRMAGCSLALLGSGLRWWTHLFIGWFGPRGLASVLFALFVVRESGFPEADRIVSIAVITVLLSILLHGASAPAGVLWYARRARRELTPECPENALPEKTQ